MKLTKTCTKCAQEKPLEEFAHQSKAKHERNAYCLVCKREISRQNYLTNCSEKRVKSLANYHKKKSLLKPSTFTIQ